MGTNTIGIFAQIPETCGLVQCHIRVKLDRQNWILTVA